MVEETTETTETTETPVVEETTPAATSAEEAKYTQADMDRITAKVKTRAEKERDKFKADAEKLREAALSDDEKKYEEATKAGAATAQAELEAFKRQASVERALLAKGVSDEVLTEAAGLIPADADDIPAAIEALASKVPGLFQETKPGFGGGGGRNSDASTPDYSPEAVQTRIQQPGGKAWYEANRAKIKQWRKEQGIGGY